MRPLRWKRVREATAVASAPELLREDAEAVLGEPCAACHGEGVVHETGIVCESCGGEGYADMQESTSGPYWVYSDDPEWEQLREASRTFSSDVRKKYAASGVAMPDGSYPIPDKDALSRAISSFGHNPTAAVKAHIKKRAAALGATASLPEDWTKESGLDNFGDKKADPIGKSKESEEVTARLDKLEGQVDQFRQLKEAKPGQMAPAFSTPTRVKTSDGQEGYRVVLIREGKGNKEDDQWYTGDAIQEMCESGVCEGMQAYGNHPDLVEEETRPERDVKQLVGHYRDVEHVREANESRAQAIFVPLTLNENNPNFGWVVTLAEAAARSTAPQPICGISLYGLSAGDDGERPDGSFGRMVSMIRPHSADIVTSAGAGGGFIRQVMESARRALKTPSQEEIDPMRAITLQEKYKGLAKRLREADPEDTEARETILKEMEALDAEKIDATTDLTVESLREAAPKLVESIEAAAKATDGETIEQLKERNSTLEKALGKFNDAISVTEALREAGVTNPAEIRHYANDARKLGYTDADDIKQMVEDDREYKKHEREQELAAMREALGIGEDTEVEGAGGRMPAFIRPGADGQNAMRESGLPMLTPDAA